MTTKAVKKDAAGDSESTLVQMRKMEAVGRAEGLSVHEMVRLMEGNQQVMDMLRCCRTGRYEPDRSSSIASQNNMLVKHSASIVSLSSVVSAQSARIR